MQYKKKNTKNQFNQHPRQTENILHWNITHTYSVCVGLCVCVFVGACVRACALVQVCTQVYVCAFGGCFVGANGLLVDVCQCCYLLVVCMLTTFETLSLL